MTVLILEELLIILLIDQREQITPGLIPVADTHNCLQKVVNCQTVNSSTTVLVLAETKPYCAKNLLENMQLSRPVEQSHVA